MDYDIWSYMVIIMGCSNDDCGFNDGFYYSMFYGTYMEKPPLMRTDI